MLRHRILEVRLYRRITWDGEAPGFDLNAVSQLLGKRITYDATGPMIEFEYPNGNVYLRGDGTLVTRGFETYEAGLVAITLATFETLTIPTSTYDYRLPMHETPYETTSVNILAVIAVCDFGHPVDIPLLLKARDVSQNANDEMLLWLTLGKSVKYRLRVHSDGRGTIVVTAGWDTPFALAHIIHRCAIESDNLIHTYINKAKGMKKA
ncbi:MAG: hypothetical protein CMI16_02690 [Opitutaceae bacterium]|nr:hypothetical protein [Opitutaceae bacterium]